jgi:proton-dependent oligopeptide transporter, POT family
MPEISEEFTKNDYVAMAAEKMEMPIKELAQYLWFNYNPSNIRIIYAGVAFSAVILLFIYDRYILKSK